MSTPAGDGHLGDATITVNANTTPAQLALRGLTRDANGQLRDLRGRFVSESRLINNSLNSVTGGSNRFKEALGDLKSAALLLSPALIPIAVQAAPIAAGAGAAAIAVGAFAAAAAGQATAITEAADAEKKYQTAVDQHGATSAQAAKAQNAYVQQINTMPPATRGAAAALSSLKDQYQAWSDSLAGSTMPVATRAFETFSAVFPKLTPLVQGASGQLNRFVTIAAGGIASPGLDALIARFAKFSTGTLQKANDALVHFARTLDTGQVGGGVSAFMDYVRANGPLVRDTIAKVAEALANVLVAASDVGPGLLTAVNAFAALVAAVPPGAITTLLQLALALKAVRIATVAMEAASAGMTAFGASLLAMRTAAASASGVVPRLTAAIGALSRSAKVAVAGTGVGLLLIAMNELGDVGKTSAPDVDKLTTSLKQLSATGKFSGELKATFSDMDGFIAKVGKLNSESAALSKVKPFLAFSGIGEFADKAVGKIDQIVRGANSLGATKDDLSSFDEAFAQLVKSGDAKVAAQEFQRFDTALRANGKSAAEVTALFPQYKAAVADAATEQQLAAQAMGLFGAQAQATSAKLAEQKASADGLRQAIQALADVNRAALGGQIALDAAIDAASKAARDNAGVLDVQGGKLVTTTEKQRTAATALSDLAAKTNEAAASAREAGDSWSTVSGIYNQGRAAFIKSAEAMGLTREEAKRLAAQIMGTPPSKTTYLKGDLEDLKRKLADAQQRLKNAPSSKTTSIKAEIEDLKRKIADAQARINNVHGKTVILSVEGRANQTAKNLAGFASGGLVQFAAGGQVQGFPGGGRIRGPGSGTSDSILARVSNGEYVIPADRVRQYGQSMFDAIRAGKLSSARAAPAPTASALGVGPVRMVSGGGPTVVNVTLNFENNAVIGSRMELQNWFAKTMEDLRLQGRLPRTA